MGKKINFQVCDDIRMFQVFKKYVRVDEDNEFFVDGNREERNHGKYDG